jgi:hypothetical protein
MDFRKNPASERPKIRRQPPAAPSKSPIVTRLKQKARRREIRLKNSLPRNAP